MPTTVPSTSLAAKVTGTCASSNVFLLADTATGGSFTSVIVNTALAGADVAPLLSVTVNGIVTVPLKLSVGLKIKPAACAAVNGAPAMTGVVPLARYKIPWLAGGKVLTFTIFGVPSSTSVPTKLTFTETASSAAVMA